MQLVLNSNFCFQWIVYRLEFILVKSLDKFKWRKRMISHCPARGCSNCNNRKKATETKWKCSLEEYLNMYQDDYSSVASDFDTHNIQVHWKFISIIFYFNNSCRNRFILAFSLHIINSELHFMIQLQQLFTLFRMLKKHLDLILHNRVRFSLE